MKKNSWLGLLMVLTIIGIAGFQFYWLKQSYDRERKTMEVKTQVAFRNSIMQLQAEKLHLDRLPDFGDSGNVRVVVSNDPNSTDVKLPPPRDIVLSTINVIRDKMKDSLRKTENGKTRVVMTLDTRNMHMNGDGFADEMHDTMRMMHRGQFGRGPREQIINLLYGVDSLQDPISVKEVNERFSKALDREHIRIPFTVVKLDSLNIKNVTVKDPDKTEFTRVDTDMNAVTVGFARPVKYKLELGNTMPFLLKRISLPIIFSFILLGISILSFTLLYRNMQQQRRLAELKNEFISNITHELKTPIATVGVAIEALKNFNALQDPQRTREYLDISSNELQRLSLLVDKVLKLSMFEKKEIELRIETLDLTTLAEEVEASMRLQLEKQHAQLTLTHSGDTTLQGDRLHLLSVIFNLVDNALKYSTGAPSIQIELTGTEKDVQLSVKDNGIGIASEYQEKIFEKFFRVPTGDTHNAKGYGLGLSYAAHVVKKHGGIISVDSQPGLGTRFTVIIPRQQA